MNRRELLKRTAMVVGGYASSSVCQAVLAGVDGGVGITNPIFNATQKRQTAVLAELIIPETDTPGAIAAGVPQFVELMVSDWYTDREREIFLGGLNSQDQFCMDGFSKPFLDCTEDQRISALEQAENEAKDYKPKKDAQTGDGEGSLLASKEDEEKPFFNKIRELTVLGYYTSEVGAKEELRYDPMPMEYGDIDFSDVGRQWSS